MAKSTTIDHSILSSDDDPVFRYTEDNEELIVSAGVTLSHQGDFTILGRGGFTGLQATIDGTVFGFGWAAFDAFESAAHITVGVTGRLQGGLYGATAIETSYDSSVVNHGNIIDQRGFGVIITDVTHAAVENDATIFGEVGGVEFVSPSIATSTASVVNSGDILTGSGSNDKVFGAGSNAAVYSAASDTTIGTSGRIDGADHAGYAIRIVAGAADIDNRGTIEAYNVAIDATGTARGILIDNDGHISGGAAAIRLGSGADTVGNTGTIVGNIFLGAGNDTYVGDDGGVDGKVYGGAGNDLLCGGAGADTLLGGDGDDRLLGNGGVDHFDGGAGSDTIILGDLGAVTVNLATKVATFPGSGDPSERIASIENAVTGAGQDTLVGGNQANELHGMWNVDHILGGGGADRLYGGTGADVFQFRAGDSTPNARDTILPGDASDAFQGAGASGGDQIDLSAYDADATTDGVQDWIFGTSHARGHLWAVDSGSTTLIRGNVDGDAAVEFEVAIADKDAAASLYTAEDFIL